MVRLYVECSLSIAIICVIIIAFQNFRGALGIVYNIPICSVCKRILFAYSSSRRKTATRERYNVPFVSKVYF